MVNLLKSPAQLSARRGTLVLCNALATAAFSGVAIDGASGHHSRDFFYFFLWFVWVVTTLLWTFGIPGFFRWSAAERATVNDELVRAHQASAAKGGFLTAIVGLGLLSASAFFRVALPGWSVIALASLTVVSSALIFAWLERRDG